MFWGVCTQPEIRLLNRSRGGAVLRIVGIFTSGVCDGHKQHVPLWNIHPFRHRLQQLLRRHPSVDPHAEERVHGDVNMAERCQTNDTMFVGDRGADSRPSPPVMDLLPSSD